MKMQSNTLVKVYAAAIVVMIPLVAAAFFTPPDFPMLLRQVLLCAWGVGATLAAERLLFSRSWRQTWRSVGFVPARLPAVVVALLVSLPMWLFLPLLAWLQNTPINYLAVGLSLVNLMVVGFVIAVLLSDESAIQFGYPVGLTIVGILAPMSGAGTIGILICAVGIWRHRTWGIVRRLHYSLITVAALYFVWYLNEVNLFLFWL
jgi:hypothetical protein